MAIKLGFRTKVTPVTTPTEDPFHGDPVITLKAAETRTRAINFSQGAVDTMHIWERTTGLEQQPEHRNKEISVAIDEENGNIFLFVNTGQQTETYDINKTTMGFRNKPLYELLASRFDLDTTVDNNLELEFYEQDMVEGDLYRIRGIYVPQMNEVNGN